MLKPIHFVIINVLISTVSGRFAIAQVPTSDSNLELRINKLHSRADSLLKAAKHFQDSLNARISIDALSPDIDSSHWLGHLPDSLFKKKWSLGLPKNFKLEIPNIPEYRFFQRKGYPFPMPKENKKRNPIDGFKGWYIEELADLGK